MGSSSRHWGARKSHVIRHLVALVAIIAGFASIAAWLVNRPETLQHALALANVRGDWHIEVARLRWSPLASEIVIDGVSVEQPATGKAFSAERVKASYRLPGLLRGMLVIDELAIDNAQVTIPPRDPALPKKPHKRINLARLVLLKHLEIADGHVSGLSLAFGKGMRLVADEMGVALVPSIFGRSRFGLHADGMRLSRNDKEILTAASAAVKTSTDLSRWDAEFPYLNAASGELSIDAATAEGIAAETIEAEFSYSDELLNLDRLALVIDGRQLTGRLTADVGNETFDLAIDIPKPIVLPYLGRNLETVDTAGELSGSIRLEGRGFMPAETDGKGHITLIHRFDVAREAPLLIDTDVNWKSGVVKLSNAAAGAGNDAFALEGEIDIPGKKMRFVASGGRFPIEHVFDKFRNPHLRKIFGPTDFAGTFEGWGKDFKAHVTGTTFDGGWRPIAASRIETELTATYNDLKLLGTLFTKGRASGSADLSITFGPKTPGINRSKFVDLTAEVRDADMAETMGSLGLAGIGTGTVTLRGPHTSFEGRVHAAIEKGGWHGIAFDHIATDIGITRRKLAFENMEVALPGAQVQRAAAPLSADIGEGSLRFTGQPVEGLSIDATYRYEGSRWSIAGIDWSDPQLQGSALSCRGSLVSGGGIDLAIRGTADTRVIPLLARPVRSASGPVDLDLAVRGSTADPRISGSVRLQQNTVRLRNPRITLADLTGTLHFEGTRIVFDEVKAGVEDGEVSIAGHLEHRGFKPASADITLTGANMRYRTEDRGLSLEFDGKLTLTGAFPNPLLAGELTILDGKYVKDFTLIDALAGEKPIPKSPPGAPPPEFNPRLDLRIRNSGDLAIRNNVGDIWLTSNIEVKGTREKPTVVGAIDATNGEVHYLGMMFDINKGFIEFRGGSEIPYLEVHAQKEVDLYNVNIALYGRIDNLQLDLSATSPQGPLEKRDVVSLLLFGATEQQRQSVQRTGSTITTEVVGQAVTGLVEQPISRLTHLDVFRLEASDPTSKAISRLNIGKQVSDRLTVKFATDINTYNAVQTFSAEYLITDNLLLKGTRSTDANYEVSGLLRFRLR